MTGPRRTLQSLSGPVTDPDLAETLTRYQYRPVEQLHPHPGSTVIRTDVWVSDEHLPEGGQRLVYLLHFVDGKLRDSTQLTAREVAAAAKAVAS